MYIDEGRYSGLVEALCVCVAVLGVARGAYESWVLCTLYRGTEVQVKILWSKMTNDVEKRDIQYIS